LTEATRHDKLYPGTQTYRESRDPVSLFGVDPYRANQDAANQWIAPATQITLSATLLLSLTITPALRAQWLGYPTKDVPKKADGSPDLSAPALRTADGKPDFSGMCGWINIGPPCGAQCADTQISREFINIASTLKGPSPYQPWAAELLKKWSIEQGSDPNVHCMPRDAPRIWADDYYKRISWCPAGSSS
jgi:hypothetical protein